ncbi:HMG-box, partial [Hanseniaspora valbyensis NRRL Y-1626]
MENVVIPERAELKNSNGKVRRPRNAFILFRSHQHKIFINGFLNAGKAIPHNSEISKMIGTQWRSLSPKEKAVWENAALKEREEHLSKYPDYKYQPVRRKVKKELRDKEK